MTDTNTLDREVVFHRYYDPATGQFLSVDPALNLTGQPYQYVYGDPVNSTDPLGLGCGIFSVVCSVASSAGNAIHSVAKATLPVLSAALGATAAVSSLAAGAALLAGAPELAGPLEGLSVATGLSAAILDSVQIRYFNESSTRNVLLDLLTTVPALGLGADLSRAAFDIWGGSVGIHQVTTTAYECQALSAHVVFV